jgi:alkanesulfonate monooxygenase SsuD/methylene tetrahydromethanopterin reductase-like flavin-dependent oxidoreductase (luciferase family)
VTPVRIGIVILPHRPWSEQAPLWRRADEAGFDHLWTYDHLTWDPLADLPWGATMPTLVAAAGVTSRATLGTWVTSPNFRHPVPLAREFAALDDVSGGRAVLGVGAGGTGHDSRVLGQAPLAPADRAARLEEFVDVLDGVLTSASTSYDGRFFRAVDARTDLPWARRPRLPFVVAANGPRTMRLALRSAQGWATTGTTPREAGDAAWWAGVAALAERFGELEADHPGPAGPLRRMLSLDAAPTFSMTSVDHFVDVVGRAGELGFTDVVTHWPVPGGAVYDGDEATVDAVAAVLPSLRDRH